MIDSNLLYSRVIGWDGRIRKEPTVLGAVLIGVALFALGALWILLGAAL